MQKTPHNIQYPRFPKLIELWEEDHRLEDCGNVKRMEKGKTEHKEDTAYTCAILVLEFGQIKASISVKGGTFFSYFIKPLSKPSILSSDKKKNCEGHKCTNRYMRILIKLDNKSDLKTQVSKEVFSKKQTFSLISLSRIQV